MNTLVRLIRGMPSLLAYAYFKMSKAPIAAFPERPVFIEYDGYVYFFLNGLVMTSGHASPMTVPPNVKYADWFQNWYQMARENKKGLWKEQ